MPEVIDGDTYYVGHKEIIEFVRPYIRIPKTSTTKCGWKKVKRYEASNGLPLEGYLSDKPYIRESVFKLWFALFQKKQAQKKGLTKRPEI